MAKILVIEDNEQLSEMLSQRLERRGHTVILAQERDVAVSTAKAAQPDLILLDSQLRGEQDWSTARALKHDDHTRGIPIIVLMANNSDEERSSAMQNGAHELHAKPVDVARLMQQINAAIGEGESDDEQTVQAQ
jgi:DNA-binding response OmpR family regulator